MAPPLPKQLGQFLQEQQEPFTLQLYLLERGHVTCNSPNSPNSCKFLKGTNLLPRCLHLVKAVLGKLSLIDATPKIKKTQDSTESDCNSSSATSDAEDAGHQTRISSTLHGKQVVADRKVRANCGEDSKQLSPVSVLEETESSEDDDDDDDDYDECFVGMSDGTNLLPPVYSKNMVARQQSGRTLDSDKLWKLICESIVMWSQDSVDETNINHLVLSDFMASGKEWRGVGEVQGKEIGVGICGILLEDICCEIVRDLISFGA
ncbi:PREDICTED: uncharacterized protein LOC109152836 [Ipomoea nil]|uniref:uncharacterized protein LOC109152836 n=1 Tax=Ipomoea nil TaxID=35883 RepID=UPI000901A2EE|nr:PREDICTED: uncharacterized protein LOC109152836 [Ipomoea nil]